MCSSIDATNDSTISAITIQLPRYCYRLDMSTLMDSISSFFVFWIMQLYMSWYIISFFRLYHYFLNIVLYFLKYSCTNIFHRRTLYTSIELSVFSNVKSIAQYFTWLAPLSFKINKSWCSHHLWQLCSAADPISFWFSKIYINIYSLYSTKWMWK